MMAASNPSLLEFTALCKPLSLCAGWTERPASNKQHNKSDGVSFLRLYCDFHQRKALEKKKALKCIDLIIVSD